LDGNHVFILSPCIAPFHLPSPRMGSARVAFVLSSLEDATSRKLVPFSHRSASRIFIRQPGCIPSPVVTQDGDHQFDGGEKRAGLRPLPRPQLQGSSSSWLVRGSPSPSAFRGEGAHRPSGRGELRQRGAGRPRASSASARWACWLSWLWLGSRCPLPPSGGARPSACRTSGRCAARTGGPPKTSRAARVAFVFLGCLAFAPVQRLCAKVGARPSGRIRVGICRWADGCRRRR
jgi:hypothetical protein